MASEQWNDFRTASNRLHAAISHKSAGEEIRAAAAAVDSAFRELNVDLIGDVGNLRNDIAYQAAWQVVCSIHHAASMLRENRQPELFAVSHHAQLVRDLHELDTIVPDSRPDRERFGDGPTEAGFFSRGKIVVPVSPMPWKLLKFMWGRHSATEEDINEAVWNGSMSASALKAAIQKLNNDCFLASDCRLSLHQKSGSVVWSGETPWSG